MSEAYNVKQARATLSIRRESTTLNRQQKNKVEEAEADHGSAGNKLSTVCHSRADVPEQLKGCMDQGVIYLMCVYVCVCVCVFVCVCVCVSVCVSV